MSKSISQGTDLYDEYLELWRSILKGESLTGESAIRSVIRGALAISGGLFFLVGLLGLLLRLDNPGRVSGELLVSLFAITFACFLGFGMLWFTRGNIKKDKGISDTRLLSLIILLGLFVPNVTLGIIGMLKYSTSLGFATILVFAFATLLRTTSNLTATLLNKSTYLSSDVEKAKKLLEKINPPINSPDKSLRKKKLERIKELATTQIGHKQTFGAVLAVAFGILLALTQSSIPSAEKGISRSAQPIGTVLQGSPTVQAMIVTVITVTTKLTGTTGTTVTSETWQGNQIDSNNNSSLVAWAWGIALTVIGSLLIGVTLSAFADSLIAQSITVHLYEIEMNEYEIEQGKQASAQHT